MEEVLLRLQATGVDEDDLDLSISDENDDPLDILSPQTVAMLLQQVGISCPVGGSVELEPMVTKMHLL